MQTIKLEAKGAEQEAIKAYLQENASEVLDHCVGRMGYDQRMARGESLIFFVRRADDPTTPLITIEFNVKSRKMVQCYGQVNKPPSEKQKRLSRANGCPMPSESLER